MARKKIEVLPASSRSVMPAAVPSEVEQIVQQKVAEILARGNNQIFEPWFRSRMEANELRRIQTVPERKRWTIHYDRFGCLYCHKTSHPHGGNGFCCPCRLKITNRLKSIVRELVTGDEFPCE